MGLNIYDKRWARVRQFFQRLNDYVELNEDCVVYWNGMIIVNHPPFSINDFEREIIYRVDNCTFVLWNGDPEQDDGAHDKLSSTIDSFRKEIHLMKRLSLDF